MIKSKLTALCTCLLLGSHYTRAQGIYLGFESGVSMNRMQTNASGRFFTNYQGLPGIAVAAAVSWEVNKWLALQTAPTFVQKNYKLYRTGYFDGVFREFHNDYWQLPVMAQFSFGTSVIQGFLNLGAYSAYWSSAATKGRQPVMWNQGDRDPASSNKIFSRNGGQTYNEKYEFDNRKDNRREHGWLAGAGIRWMPGPLSRIYLECRYYDSQSDQQKNYMLNRVGRYNQTICISLGYQYRLAKLNRLF
ncbi:outer membrane beta-barrel protein [Chitinophaga sp.]|uniref:outer membrane beta-barrel protein n=1 Tax=Chitinophaga sp. TaxID=1869181 RepID=UPI0031D8403C